MNASVGLADYSFDAWTVTRLPTPLSPTTLSRRDQIVVIGEVGFSGAWRWRRAAHEDRAVSINRRGAC